MANDTEVARQPEHKTIKGLIKSDDFKNAVSAALPRHLKPERFVRVALNAVMRKPDLLECTQESFFLCLLDLSSYGLEPDGRRAHLIPFKDNKVCICGHDMDQHKGPDCTRCGCKQRRSRTICTLIIDYKGLAECVRRSGDVSYIHADVVYDNDEFKFKFGSGAMLEHVPAEDHDGKKIKWAYSFVKLRDGSEDFVVMSLKDVERIRKRSRAADAGPWVSDFPEMAKKTAFRRHTKWLPLSAETREIVERDDDMMGDIDTDAALDLAGSTEMRVNIPLESLTPSENVNRGHDESMTTEAPAASNSGLKKVTQEDVERVAAEVKAKKAAAPTQEPLATMTEEEMAAETAKQDEAREKKRKPAAKDDKWS